MRPLPFPLAFLFVPLAAGSPVAAQSEHTFKIGRVKVLGRPGDCTGNPQSLPNCCPFVRRETLIDRGAAGGERSELDDRQLVLVSVRLPQRANGNVVLSTGRGRCASAATCFAEGSSTADDNYGMDRGIPREMAKVFPTGAVELPFRTTRFYHAISSCPNACRRS